MTRLRLGAAVSAGLAIALTSSVSAAVPVPRAGCFLVRDAKGDEVTWPPEQPLESQLHDPALDLVGLNVGMTPSTLTVYVSTAKLAPTPRYGLGLKVYASFAARGKTISMWLESFGDLQPVRNAVPPVQTPDVQGQPLRRIRTPNGAEVAPTSDTVHGTAIPVSASMDLSHSYVSWTFRRVVVEKALGVRLTRGLPLIIGEAGTEKSSAGVEDIIADSMAGSVYRVGAKGCV